MEKIRLLADLAEFAQKNKYKVECCATHAEEVALVLQKSNITFVIEMDLQNPKTEFIKNVFVEKNCKQPEQKYFSSLRALETSLRSYK